ncbi:hypothetical protein [Pseudonocardia abyssalis]|uniref:Uncharacterized protein n=1 Tax=Pseudonocardia abyssalis TaxID=2792008 RepID=A0ABS6UXH0_9PSEU|nr:hypothetical protein [Pseudonocardia abyssalis]MBW0114681.1 hypothetical protein [Pseudonocardia abyssalis]MBW0136676.1 hypothetical protein [Pseudonocardia abyssalis]
MRTNLFSFYNSILFLFVIGTALLLLGHYSDALTNVGLGLTNAVICAQEIRARRKLDRLQLLDQAQVAAIRNGADVELEPHEVVRDDLCGCGWTYREHVSRHGTPHATNHTSSQTTADS